MRVLTVRQPWSEAIIFGGKDVENRVRNVAGGYRGPIAIHTAKREPKPEEWRAFDKQFPDAMSQMVNTVPWSQEEFGVIIGVVDLVDVHQAGDCWDRDMRRVSDMFWNDKPAFYELPDSGAGGVIGRTRYCSPWADRIAYHLVLANPRALVKPIPYKGALGLRHLDDDTTAHVLAQIGANHA